VRRALAAMALAALLAGCGESAQQLLQTAELEEVQNAPERARELYQRIVRVHPNTPEATKAAARLRVLESEPGA